MKQKQNLEEKVEFLNSQFIQRQNEATRKFEAEKQEVKIFCMRICLRILVYFSQVAVFISCSLMLLALTLKFTNYYNAFQINLFVNSISQSIY